MPDIVRGYTVTNDIDALDQQGRTARKEFSPANPGTITPGDTIEITHDGVGTLVKNVVAPQN